MGCCPHLGLERMVEYLPMEMGFPWGVMRMFWNVIVAMIKISRKCVKMTVYALKW